VISNLRIFQVKKYLLSVEENDLNAKEKAHLLYSALESIYKQLLAEHGKKRWTSSKSRLETALENEMATLEGDWPKHSKDKEEGIKSYQIPKEKGQFKQAIQSILEGNEPAGPSTKPKN